MPTNPFTAPAPAGSGLKWADLLGRLLVIEPKGVTNVDTALGPRDAVRADVHAIDGEVEDFEDALVFPKVLQGQLRGKVDQMVLGRLAQGQAKPGQSAPWVLADPTQADMATAEAWLAARQQPKFAAPAAGDRPPF